MGWGGENTTLTQWSLSLKSLEASVFFFSPSSTELQRVIPSEGFRWIEEDCVSITSCVLKSAFESDALRGDLQSAH